MMTCPNRINDHFSTIRTQKNSRKVFLCSNSRFVWTFEPLSPLMVRSGTIWRTYVPFHELHHVLCVLRTCRTMLRTCKAFSSCPVCVCFFLPASCKKKSGLISPRLSWTRPYFFFFLFFSSLDRPSTCCSESEPANWQHGHSRRLQAVSLANVGRVAYQRVLRAASENVRFQ